MRFATLIMTLALSLAGCSQTPLGSSDIGLSFQTYQLAALADSIFSTPDYPSPEARYAATPPCLHRGLEHLGASDHRRCNARNEQDVAYWVARTDTYKLACKQSPTSAYCDASTGMIPHCHGFGRYRFCHSHPGGAEPHDHIGDGEMAQLGP